MLYDDTTASQTYELYGPKQYSTAEIAEMVDKEIFTKRRHINVPRQILEPAARILNKLLWWPMLSAEQIQMEHIDQVIDEKAKTFKDLGIEPGEISKFTYQYVVSFNFFFESRAHLDTYTPCSKDSAAVHSTICRLRVRRRRERRGSICTFLMTNRKEKTGFGERQEWVDHCKYVTRVSRVFNSKRNTQEHGHIFNFVGVVTCCCWRTLRLCSPTAERLSLTQGEPSTRNFCHQSSQMTLVFQTTTRLTAPTHVREKSNFDITVFQLNHSNNSHIISLQITHILSQPRMADSDDEPLYALSTCPPRL